MDIVRQQIDYLHHRYEALTGAQRKLVNRAWLIAFSETPAADQMAAFASKIGPLFTRIYETEVAERRGKTLSQLRQIARDTRDRNAERRLNHAMNQLRAVEKETKARNELRRSGFISVTFELTFRSTGQDSSTQRYTVILPSSSERLLPELNRHIPWSQLQDSVQAISAHIKDLPLETREVLELLEHWVRSPPVYGVVSSRPVPSEGVDRLDVRYGLDDQFGAMVSHPNLGVVAKNVNGQLKLQLASHDALVINHEAGRNDCFFVNLLTADFGKHWTGARKQFNLDWVMKAGKFRSDAPMTGVALPETTTVFDVMRLASYVQGIEGRSLVASVPEVFNKKGQQSLYQLAHNSHLYLLDRNKQSLSKKPAKGEVKKPSARCFLPKYIKRKEHFVRTPEAMEALILEHAANDAKVSVQYDGNIEQLFVHFLQRHRYEASIKASNYQLTGMKMHIGEAQFNVQVCKLQHEAQLVFETPEIYDLAAEQIYRFQCGLMNELTRSCYSSGVMKAFNAYPMGGLFKRLVEGIDQCAGFDMVRAYPAIAKEMEFMPVLSEHDDFMVWDGVLRDDSFYLVENVDGDVRASILCNRRYGLQVGAVLREAKTGLKILSELTPSRLHENPMPRLLEGLYASALTDKLKKKIANIVIGQCTKRINRNERYLFFRDGSEAKAVCGDNILATDYGFIGRQGMKETVMREGWAPFGLAIYARMRLKLLQAYDALTAAGRTVVGFRTDMIQVLDRQESDFPCVRTKRYEDLGRWHLEDSKEVAKHLLVCEENELCIEPMAYLTQQVVEEAPSKSERVPSNCGHEGHGGSGKTYGLQQQFSGCRETVLWLAPMNKRVEALKLEGWPQVWTVAQFIGCHKKGGTWIFNEKLPDVPEGVTAVIVDEIFQLTLQQRERLLSRLLDLGLRCFYTGDPDQICIDNGHYNNMSDERRVHSLAKVFPYKIIHSQDYRRRTVEDKVAIAEAERRLKAGEDRLTVLKDYFHCTEDEGELLKHDLHLVKCNTTALKVNLAKRGSAWAVGMPVVCRSHTVKGMSNYEEAVIEGVDEKRVMIKGNWYSRAHFRLGWAQTIASTQGDTIDQDYSIWDALHSYTTVKELITALGRCREVKQVHVYVGKQKLDLGPLRDKVDGVLRSDYDAGREVPKEERVTLEWLRETAKETHYLCGTCHTEYLMEWDAADEKAKMKSVSIDRKDSSLGHSKKNCWLVHRECNHAKKDTFM